MHIARQSATDQANGQARAKPQSAVMTSSSKKEQKPGTWWSKAGDVGTWIRLGRKTSQGSPETVPKPKTGARIGRRMYRRGDAGE